MTTKTKPNQAQHNPESDVPFTATLPDGRTLFVLLPAKWCEVDKSGEVLLKPEAVEHVDKVQVLAMHTPEKPTPGYIKTLRLALGLTQQQMADKLGVAKITVARWEWGYMTPHKDTAKKIDKLRYQAGKAGLALAA